MEKDRDAIFGLTRRNQVTKSRPLESQFTLKPVARLSMKINPEHEKYEYDGHC